jgi:hypothetical protein
MKNQVTFLLLIFSSASSLPLDSLTDSIETSPINTTPTIDRNTAKLRLFTSLSWDILDDHEDDKFYQSKCFAETLKVPSDLDYSNDLMFKLFKAEINPVDGERFNYAKNLLKTEICDIYEKPTANDLRHSNNEYTYGQIKCWKLLLSEHKPDSELLQGFNATAEDLLCAENDFDDDEKKEAFIKLQLTKCQIGEFLNYKEFQGAANELDLAKISSESEVSDEKLIEMWKEFVNAYENYFKHQVECILSEYEEKNE